ncbi:hypothetical protein AVEN_60972-1 [Araneus ventricosus]|uniref:Uncharacterized protein n=1 Tax=Araneus ventricosus TaxID=182803 RepID=A0A4Y2DE53_ARAVE|nr:hypothetical protein AVEN_60972-1 [Araneus ventricosus]
MFVRCPLGLLRTLQAFAVYCPTLFEHRRGLYGAVRTWQGSHQGCSVLVIISASLSVVARHRFFFSKSGSSCFLFCSGQLQSSARASYLDRVSCWLPAPRYRSGQFPVSRPKISHVDGGHCLRS